ncbi:Uma2 family endonuclease [Micromonospora coxensis]|uniref:Uma2 family endonuclease n=1 Tax=Micromonospora coxensis TaxID=356852 RepID=UPI0034355532
MIPLVVLDHPMPWSEPEYLALGTTACRIELVDGGLLIGPPPALRHQALTGGLADALTPGCDAAGLLLLPVVNLRLGPARIVNPDLVVTGPIDLDGPCVPAAAVRLVAEVDAPHTAVIDSVLKRHLYATAGIEWYLLVEQETGTLRLFRRRGRNYAEQATVKRGEALELTEPVRATIRPEDLVP